jgi:hypothetical protein
MTWKMAGKERVWKNRNFSGFNPEVKILKESQDNGCCGGD